MKRRDRKRGKTRIKQKANEGKGTKEGEKEQND
jgi:hypothetical protein